MKIVSGRGNLLRKLPRPEILKEAKINGLSDTERIYKRKYFQKKES